MDSTTYVLHTSITLNCETLPCIKGYSMNKQSSYRVVDVLTTDTRSMFCEISVLPENVERKCVHYWNYLS